MSRNWLLYLDDLIASAEKISRFVTGQTLESLIADEALFDAVLFNLQVIDEAIKKLPEEVRESVPGMSGAGPARLRDLIAHHYFAVDAEIIWGVATEHVPQLLAAARVLRDRVDREGK
ncbi:MAG TPA: DUF86 domain-containing protein [Thermoanaerobaculia bacterium]